MIKKNDGDWVQDDEKHIVDNLSMNQNLRGKKALMREENVKKKSEMNHITADWVYVATDDDGQNTNVQQLQLLLLLRQLHYGNR